MDKIRWGILGAGKIANKFAADLMLVENASLTAVASRNKAKGTEFKNKFGIPFFFESYEQMASSPQVDVIYVATPHGLHFENVMLCLEYRKPVLCEKAFGLNFRQVELMVATARKNNVFLMEAFWTKFLPQYQKLHELVSAGSIGRIRMIQADFGFLAAAPFAPRIFDPQLGGGSLLDIGIYPVFLAQSLLGRPVDIVAIMTPSPTGVDEQCGMILKFADGELAVLSSTFAADTPVEAWIAGDQGRIHLRNRFHNAVATMEIVKGVNAPEQIAVYKENGSGYQFEARHVGDCLNKGLIESPVMTHNDSLNLMETLDRIRAACGIKYNVD